MPFVQDFVHLLYNMKGLTSSDVKAYSWGKYVKITLQVAVDAGLKEHSGTSRPTHKQICVSILTYVVWEGEKHGGQQKLHV